MYIKNKRGLSTLPCATPEVTGAGPDVRPSTVLVDSYQQGTPDPHEEVVTDAIVLQFDGQQLMGYLVERLAKVKQDSIDLLSLV